MQRTVSIVAGERGWFRVEINGEPVSPRFRTLEKAITVAALVARAELEDGDDAREAEAELDRLAVEPPILPSGPEPVPVLA